MTPRKVVWLVGLAREGLHDAHAREILSERRRDQAEPLANAAIGMVRARPEPGGREAHQREDDQRREREPPVEEEEHDYRSREDEGVLDEAREAVGDELVERLDVVRDAAHRRAGAVALVVAEREALQMVEQPDPQIGQTALADPAGEVRLRAREHERGDAGDEERDHDDRERLQVAVRDPVVDRELREVRGEQRDARVGDERHDRERCACLVRLREAREHAEPTPGLAPRPVIDLRAALV